MGTTTLDLCINGTTKWKYQEGQRVFRESQRTRRTEIYDNADAKK